MPVENFEKNPLRGTRILFYGRARLEMFFTLGRTNSVVTHHGTDTDLLASIYILKGLA